MMRQTLPLVSSVTYNDPSGPTASPHGRAAASPGFVKPVLPAKPSAKTSYLPGLSPVNGTNVTLSDYKGKVILIDFWATWCGPCKVEIPWFVELQTKYGKDGLQALGVSVDDTVDKLKPYVAELKMNYPVLQGLGHDDMQDAYGPLWGIPVTVVISRDGKICTKHIGFSAKESFEKEIKSLL